MEKPEPVEFAEKRAAKQRGMKVLHTNFLRGWGGQSNRILTEALGVAGAGWEVLISAPSDSELLKRGKATGIQTSDCISYAGGARLAAFADIGKMRRLLNDTRPDLIHLHGGRDSWTVAGALVRPIAKDYQPIVIRTKHNVFPIADHVLNRWQYGKFFQTIICLSQAIVAQCAEKPYIDAAKLELIPSAVDFERFNITPSARVQSGAGVPPANTPEDDLGPRERIRAELGFSNSDIVVGMTGRLRAEKGHDILFRAMPAVIAANPAVKFLLLGAGSLQGDLVDQLKREGCAGHAILAGFRKDIPDCLQATDIYTQPSRSEGLGTSVLEACAAGLPIVASRTGGIPDIIEHEVNGLLVKPESPEELATALLRLANDLPLRQRLAAAARPSIESRFSVQALAQSTLDLYNRLVAEKR